MQEKLTVVCFGDSLTAGYIDGVRYAPYGQFLQERLGERGSVIVRGQNGELTESMVRRFSSDVLVHKPSHVIVLGGTNDLGQGLSPEQILGQLRLIYQELEDAKVQGIALNIPSVLPENPHEEWVSQAIKAREEVNELIRQECLARDILYLDLFTETSSAPEKTLLEALSSDGLHFNEEGYKTIAAFIWDHVFEKLFAKE